ncbi:hypothetical protein B0T26DRAFT_630319, partial [Lasiosphaeria miniovina]
ESERRWRRRERHERRDRRPPPKHFLFCFPWVKSRRVRTQILRCFVSGMFLLLMLAVYLSLSLTKNINSSEFTVLLILIILFVTIIFCYGLVRLCILLVRGDHHGNTDRLPEMRGPGGYAIPEQPIRVVLARDEEAAGIESETTKIKPPAYGLWRESVRVDPNRIYWMRNHDAPPLDTDKEEAGSSHAPRTTAPRPPSYASEDGVSYVVEARPRSMAPTTNVPVLPHPSETGRAG